MTLDAGIIGTGGVAGLGLLGMHDEADIGADPVPASHAGGYARSDRIDLVAAADIDADQLQTFGEIYDIPAARRYTDHEAMLAVEDLDVVSVATPTYLHHDHVIDAARSAAAPDVIWCEKPIAASVADAEAMVETCAETDTDLVVNHTTRFTDNMIAVREHLRDGLLGDVRSVSTMFRMEVVRNATHVLDTLVFLLDTEARTVSGYLTGENEVVDALGADVAVDDQGGGGHVVFADGTFATVDCTVPREIATYRYELVGTDGKLSIGITDGEWRYWTLTEDGHVEADLPGVAPDPDEWARGFATAVDHLADLATDPDTTNRSPGETAIESLEMIVALFVSHYTDSHISLPLADPVRDVTVTSW
ncbi:MAG: Gfo/Idh/MocA family protein [Halobacteriaceae archaeon]